MLYFELRSFKLSQWVTVVNRVSYRGWGEGMLEQVARAESRVGLPH